MPGNAGAALTSHDCIAHGVFRKLKRMSAPLVPSPLDYVGRRRFSFYPPIRAAGPNEWFLRNGDWSEIQIVNAENGEKIWVPRQYVCGVSGDGGTQLVVELTKELDYREGAVSPLVKQVIEMPRPPKSSQRKLKKRRRRVPAAVVDIRIDSLKSQRVRTLAKIGLSAIAIFVFSVVAALIGRL
jgi:hypothetical protein